jgi:hypothetical protein
MEIEPKSSPNQRLTVLEIDVSSLPQPLLLSIPTSTHKHRPRIKPDKSTIGAADGKSNCTLRHTTGTLGLDDFNCVQRLFSRRANSCGLLPKSDARTNV